MLRTCARQAWWILPLVTCATLYFWLFAGFMPMSEFRDWIHQNNSLSTFGSMIERIVFRDQPFSRPFSLWLAGALGEWTGRNTLLMNGILIAMVLAAGGLIYALLRSMQMPRHVAAAALLLWGTSTPAFDLLCWQATIHDRISLLGGLSALLLVNRALQRDLTPTRILLVNLGCTVSIMLAFNSKESSWYTLPGLVCMVALWTWQRQESLLRYLSILALPILYGLYYFVRSALHLQDPVSGRDHGLAGSFKFNLWHHTRDLTTLNYSEGGLLTLSIILAAGGVLLIQQMRRRQDPSYYTGAVLLLLTLGSGTLPMFAVYAPPYYMAIPMVFFAALCVLLVHVFVSISLRWLSPKYRTSVFCLLLLTLTVMQTGRSITGYIEMKKQHNTICKTLPILRAHIPADRPLPMRFHIPGLAARFFEGTGQTVAELFLAAPNFATWPSRHIEAIFLCRTGPKPESGYYTIFYDSNADLKQVWSGTDLVWQRPE